MKSFKEFVKESSPSKLSFKGKMIDTIRHHDEMEMQQYMQSPEGKNHIFVGKDKVGKPHTAEVKE